MLKFEDILGHEQLNTTQIYTHVSDANMEQAMTKNPLANIRGEGRGLTTVQEKKTAQKPLAEGAGNEEELKNVEIFGDSNVKDITSEIEQ